MKEETQGFEQNTTCMINWNISFINMHSALLSNVRKKTQA